MKAADIKLNRQRIQQSLRRTIQTIPIKLYRNPNVDTSIQQREANSNWLMSTFLKVFSTEPHIQKTSLCLKRDFYEDYIKLTKIGEGAHATISKCYHTHLKKYFAVKIFRTGDVEAINNIKKSFFISKGLKHKHLRQTYQLFINEVTEEVHLVCELIEYPSLKYFIRQQCVFDEARLKRLVLKLITALKYLHSKGITHRDVKPDNILYSWETQDLKLIDFEISKSNKSNMMWSMTGSLDYKAPEMFDGSGYGQLVDVWAVGVTLYQLVTYRLPFQSEYQSQTIQNILEKEPDYTDPAFGKYSRYFCEFLTKLIRKDSRKRLNCAECLKSSWMLHLAENKQNIELANTAVKHPGMVQQVYTTQKHRLQTTLIKREDLKRNLRFDIYLMPKD